MSLTKKCRLFLYLLCSFSFVFAGNERGNGGAVYVCRDSSQEIVEFILIDYFEAIEVREMSLYIGSHNLSIEKRIDFVLKRLERFDPTRAQRYRKAVKAFKYNSHDMDNINIVAVGDVFPRVKPKGCEIELVIVQGDSQIEEDKKYLINQEYWEHPLMNDSIRAGLILHEVIYTDAIKLGQNNSFNVRYFNSLIISKKFDDFDLKEYVNKLYSIDFTSKQNIEEALIKIGDYKFRLDPRRSHKLKIYYNNNVKEGYVFNGYVDSANAFGKIDNNYKVYFHRNGQISKLCWKNKTGTIISNGVTFDKLDYSSFHNNGQFEYLDWSNKVSDLKWTNPDGEEFALKCEYGKIKGKRWKKINMDFMFYNIIAAHENGYFAGSTICKLSSLPLYSYMNLVSKKIIDAQSVWFHDNGNIESFKVFDAVNLYFKNKKLSIWGEISLYENGNLKSATGIENGFDIEIDNRKFKTVTIEDEFKNPIKKWETSLFEQGNIKRAYLQVNNYMFSSNRDVMINGLHLRLSLVPFYYHFYENGRFKRLKLKEDFNIRLEFIEYTVDSNYPIYLNETGSLQSFRLKENYKKNLSASSHLIGKDLSLDLLGSVVSMVLWTPGHAKIQNKNVFFKKGTKVEFFENNMIKSGILGKDTILKDVNNDWMEYKENTEIVLTKEGLVEEEC